MATRLDPRLPNRFWEKTKEQEVSGCWIWTASCADGYGSFRFNRKLVSAHRLAYLTLVGPIEAGLDLDHLCRVRECCNPAHLEPVTHLVNVQRGDGGKLHASKTQCPAGHEYTPSNTITKRINGIALGRQCRACVYARQRAARAARRAA